MHYNYFSTVYITIKQANHLIGTSVCILIADHDLHTSVILYQLQEYSCGSSAFLFSRCSPNFQASYKGEWYLINLLSLNNDYTMYV